MLFKTSKYVLIIVNCIYNVRKQRYGKYILNKFLYNQAFVSASSSLAIRVEYIQHNQEMVFNIRNYRESDRTRYFLNETPVLLH